MNLKNLIETLPGSIYWKDLDGIYLDCNNYLKMRIATGPVVGGTDYMAFKKETADQFRSHDMEAIKQKDAIIKKETIILPNGKNLSLISSKKPFIDENGNMAGVIGISIYITNFDSFSDFLNNPKISKNVLALSGKWAGTYLTSRQAQCAYYLCCGKTTKEIASLLFISPRTVEDYIKQLKVKLGCFKKSALIEILISEGIFSDLKNL